MINLCFADVSAPSIDDVTRFGLMYSDGENLHFLHQTFAEFYVAKFLHKMIFPVVGNQRVGNQRNFY
jgi:hypothetical protein